MDWRREEDMQPIKENGGCMKKLPILPFFRKNGGGYKKGWCTPSEPANEKAIKK